MARSVEGMPMTVEDRAGCSIALLSLCNRRCYVDLHWVSDRADMTVYSCERPRR